MGKPALISKAVAYLRNPRQRKPVLPAFWDCEWSSEYDRWYYVNEKTNVTTWEVPTKPAEGAGAVSVACFSLHELLVDDRDDAYDAINAMHEA